jgi:hypothetical protein
VAKKVMGKETALRAKVTRAQSMSHQEENLLKCAHNAIKAIIRWCRILHRGKLKFYMFLLGRFFLLLIVFLIIFVIVFLIVLQKTWFMSVFRRIC